MKNVYLRHFVSSTNLFIYLGRHFSFLFCGPRSAGSATLIKFVYKLKNEYQNQGLKSVHWGSKLLIEASKSHLGSRDPIIGVQKKKIVQIVN